MAMPGFYFYADLANHYERTAYVAASVIALTLAGIHIAIKVRSRCLSDWVCGVAVLLHSSRPCV